ncbi:alpha/beta fold hydrolase [Streptomyces sp. NPDC086989]|uniref:alpha/beta fold hydrolase n=1 Tax=Streptomyces sp. NPDC086989 TaxID=3365764 RepID=UPI0038222D59
MTVSEQDPSVRGRGAADGGSIVSLDDGDIHVRQDGPRGAPALLLVHGSASSTRSWDAMAPLLTGAHRVIRIDLLGHGRSARPARSGYGVPDQARRAGMVLDRLGVEHAVAVGHSSGGVVATALAEQRPALVSALALINTGPALDALRAPETAAVDLAQWPPTDEQLRAFASTAVSRPGYQIPEVLLDDVRGMTLHTLATTTHAIRSYLQEQPLPNRLTVLGKPLLVLFGEADRRWRSSSAADYLKVPGAQVELLPGLGHSPLLEDPQRTAGSLLAFTAPRPARVD